MKGRKDTVKEKIEKSERDKNYRCSICSELCKHLASGYSMESFPGLPRNVIRDLIARYPEDFPACDIDTARAHGMTFWEGLGRAQSNGTCLGNSKSWIYNMSNRYGWRERQEVESDVKGTLQVSIVDYSTKKKPSE